MFKFLIKFLVIGSLYLENCVFRDSVGLRAGAIYMLDFSLTLKNCSFYNLVSRITGGAIRAFYTTVSVSGCIFHNNTAVPINFEEYVYIGGGALALSSCLVSLFSSNFTNNRCLGSYRFFPFLLFNR